MWSHTKRWTGWFSIINLVDNVNEPPSSWYTVYGIQAVYDGLTFETSALKLFTEANLHYKLSW